VRVEGYRIHEWGGPLRWEAFEVSEPRTGEVRIRVEACGIGLTVLNCIRGDLANDAARLPRVPGHEIVGVIDAVGPEVTSFAVGDRVMAYFYLVCGNCDACRTGQDSLCRNLAGWVGVHRDGGYAPYTVLPARNAVALPAHIPAAQATAIPDAIATPLHVCKSRARIHRGDRAVIIGAGGGVGIHMVEMAALFGASVVGLEASESKFDTIRAKGGTPILSRSFSEVDLKPAWGLEPPTVVIDLLGSRASLEWGIRALALGGRLVVLTTFRDVDVVVSPRDLVLREVTVLGSRYASKGELAESARLVAGGKIHPVVSHVVRPSQIESVHHALEAGSLIGRGAVIWDA
jgi:propanol-preferring alcohol dehydrogenase